MEKSATPTVANGTFASPANAKSTDQFCSPTASNSGDDDDGTATQALRIKVQTCQQNLAAAEVEVERLKAYASDFFQSKCELQETLVAIQKDPAFYLDITNKVAPFARKYAVTIKVHLDCVCALEAAQEALKDANLTTYGLKADIKVALKEQEATFKKELCKQEDTVAKLLTTVGALTARLGLMDKVLGLTSKNEDILNKAVIDGDAATVAYLVKNGVVPTIRPNPATNMTFDSALHHACKVKQNLEIVKILIPVSKAVINTAAGNHGNTPLQLAAAAACLPTVEFLVAHGATIAGTGKFTVPQGADGDLVTGFLQTRGSQPVVRR